MHSLAAGYVNHERIDSQGNISVGADFHLSLGFNRGTKVTDKVGLKAGTGVLLLGFKEYWKRQKLSISLKWTNYLATHKISADYRYQSFLI